MNLLMKNFQLAVATAILAVLMLSPAASWARSSYKWVDDNGVVHYSDRMRANHDASIISVTVDEPTDEADDSESGDETAKDASTDQAQMAANAAADKKQKAVRKANCASAREQLATNQSLARMYRLDKKGERQYLNDQERADVIKSSVESVKYWCE